MQYFERTYLVFAFFMKWNGPKPWWSSTWEQISDATRPLFSAARDRAAVRTTQISDTPKGESLVFGKITHDARGAAKWTHDTNGALFSGEKPRFLSTEVWAPSWNKCVRENRSPDVFLNISNRYAFIRRGTSTPRGHEALCILAVAEDLGHAATILGNEAASAINMTTLSDIAVKSIKPWGTSSGSGGGFTNAIQDLALTEPFRPPIRDPDEPLDMLLSLGWSHLVSP